MAAPSADIRPLRSAPIDRLTSPIRRFLRIEAASGLVLALAAAIALVLANTAWGPAVHAFWQAKIGLAAGGWSFEKPLEFWINDGLMAIFFFVVGLEIKREILTGELRSVRKATLPVVAALGGMIVPAGVYLAFGHAGEAQRGWGVPMATDIAFVVGLLAAVGRRAPFGLKIFLLSLAIADDLGAILVIAVAYTDRLDWLLLAFAAAGFGLTILMNALGIRALIAYVAVALVTWYFTYRSGIHPTIAGVLFGMLTPHRAWLGRETLKLALTDVANEIGDRPEPIDLTAADVAVLRYAAREAVAPLQRLEDRLHPWVSFAIMPLFALANAGVEVNLAALGENISLAIVAGLVLGKPLGIVLFAFIAVKLKLAMLPSRTTWRHLIAAGFLGGIGFTMSLFISGLAFVGDPAMLATAKAGVLLGSILAAAIGAMLLYAGPVPEDD